MVLDVQKSQYNGYIRRRGRITQGQKRALSINSSQYLSLENDAAIESAKHFIADSLSLNKPLVMDIGFGMGDSTFLMALQNPEINYIAVELYQPGIGALLSKLYAHQLLNVYIIEADIKDVLSQLIPEDTLMGVHIFFPDPWPKKRHKKRRLIQESFTHLVAQKVKKEGYIHCATDIEDYSQQIAKLFMESSVLSEPIMGVKESKLFPSFVRNRPMTKFEKIAFNEGRKVIDICSFVL